MTIESYPVWSFEPEWSSSVSEMLEWLTDVMASPNGSEQRRSLRYFPRRSLEFSAVVADAERQLLDNMLISFGGTRWYLPLWHEVNLLDVTAIAGAQIVVSDDARNGSQIKVGSIVYFAGEDAYTYELAEVATLTADGFTTVSPLLKTWGEGTRVFPVCSAELTDQPQLNPRTSNLVSAEIRFRVMDAESDPGEPPIIAGPLIVDSLIVNAYHQETGRGGYFHHNSGTSEGQFIFIYGCFLAYEQLSVGTPEQKSVADFYLNLALDMLDAMGDGSLIGPMLRQPVPDDPNTITLIHWLFAARGDIPGQRIVYNYEVAPAGGTLTIPNNANGGSTFKVWSIYPGTSELLYESPFSPAFDIASPGAETQIALTDADWYLAGSSTVINIPAGSPSHATWKVVYGFNTEQIIPAGDGFEAYPTWTKIEPGYSACAPDTFRWFEQAMTKAIEHDDRFGMAAQWDKLRAGMRRTAVKGQAISDLREVIIPMPGFDPIPVKGAPDGMYCFSDHPQATGPTVPGANSGWVGYNFWSRAANGDILGTVPHSDTLAQVQIGRGFADQWREATSYQEADQYLYIAVSATKKPVVANNEYFLAYVSSTMAYDPATRWYADLGSLAEFVATSGDVIEFFIPRSAFKLRSYNPDGSSSWGSVLPASTLIENFGISSEMTGAYEIRLRAIRLVSGPSEAWVLANRAEAIEGSQMPFFPGALPFAINADLLRQQFVGWNGSPFHGYQLADHWWWLEADANYIHPALTVADLPVPHPTTGAFTYPITANTAGGVAKPKHALLMEQQLHFLKAAQDQWAVDGGPDGFFAHTFVLNTPARASLGNPTPHSWVYVNDDPNTRWVGYQTRIVESLAELVLLTTGDTAFADARTMALTMINKWLTRLNSLWPDLNGKTVNGTLIYGMPTDFPDPSISAPQTLYEEPHAAAHILRACLTMRVAGAGNTGLMNALMVRCWNYLEMLWRTSGEMRFTWSPDPAARQWYGFWHGDILSTLSLMLDAPEIITPLGIEEDTIKERLVETSTWLADVGIGTTRSISDANLHDVYRDFHVMAMEPDTSQRFSIDYERNFVELDNRTAIPYRRDEAMRPFTLREHTWALDGRAEHAAFARMLQVLRGRAIPVWVPTFMDDFIPRLAITAGTDYIDVTRCGYTAAGGPRWDRQDIMIETVGGLHIYRRITGSTEGIDGERLVVDRSFEDTYPLSDILRISFVALMRLNQDSIQIEHEVDNAGVSNVKATFRSAPDTRIPESAFNE